MTTLAQLIAAGVPAGVSPGQAAIMNAILNPPVVGFSQFRLAITANDGNATYTSLDQFALFVGATNVGASATFSASSSNGADGPHLLPAADANPWVTAAGSAVPASVTAVLASPVEITSYSLTSQHAVTGRTPTAWTLDGSNDGAAWTTIDTRSGITGWGIQETRTFTLT